ncbi:MAG: transglycosylase domain-containing protein [Rubritalea sp.]|uniref:transglycosylase domain-containing protein n=1 Tax=Rubritalea sp. TaxID=2109375 RepID=UPI00324300D0
MIRKKFNSRRKVRKKAIFLRKWFLALVFVAILGMVGAFISYRIVSEPYRERAKEYDMALVNVIELPSLIYDREEREIGRLFVENRSPIPIEEIPQKMIDALISGEDKRFFDHNGVDFIGIGRAAYLNFKSGDEDSGASSLTMQLARNAYDLKAEALKRGESNYERKLVEIYLAQRIEKHYTKQKILEFYLNRVAFGSGYFGVRSASLGYFGKEAKDLDTQECASLVGCIKNPSVFSPLRSKKNNKKARDHVLNRMALEGRITLFERDRLQALPVETNPNPIQRNTTHIYDRIAATVKDHVSADALAKGDLRVFTSIDRDIQRALERKLKEQLDLAETNESYNHPRYSEYERTATSRPKYLQGAALMVDNNTGEVIAYIGGRDFSHSQYDFIEAGRKPLGTAFFPFIYAAALEAGETLSSRLIDEAMDNRQVMIDGVEGILGEWGSEVNEPRYEGEILLRHALATSKIAATVRLGRKVGLDKVRLMAKRFGFSTPRGKALPRELMGTESVSLSELVRAYAAFATNGSTPSKMVWVTRIERGDGTVVYSNEGQAARSKQTAVLQPATAYLTHSVLESALKEGSGKRGYDAAGMEGFRGGGKTGTTSDFADNWFVGYNSKVSCAVWAGFWDGSREEIYHGAFSVDTVMPVWADAMKIYQRKYKPLPVVRPEGVELMKICKTSGLRVTLECEEYERNLKTGKMETVSTATNELYDVKSRPLGYCDEHGSGSRGSDASAFSLTRHVGARKYKDIQPVQPIAPTLLGDDPYNSSQPAFVPKDLTISTTSRGLEAVNPDVLTEQDDVSIIHMERPGKVLILAD